MPGSDFRAFAGLQLAILLCGCASTQQELDFRQRMEIGVVAPEDIERFAIADKTLANDMVSVRERRVLDETSANEAWFSAVQSGSLESVKKQLAQGALVNARDPGGRSALAIASQQGNAPLARMLLKAGAKVDGLGEDLPPLSAAVIRGHTDVVKLLVRAGVDVDATAANGHAPLVDAVRLNRMEIVSLLLQANASKRSVDRMGDNVLLIAVDENNPSMLRTLLSGGVPVDLMDGNGLTALYWAENRQRLALVEILRTAGADPQRKKTELITSNSELKGDW